MTAPQGRPVATTPSQGRQHLPLVALLSASGVSLIGNQLTALAIPWFVLKTTGSAKLLGLTGFAQGCAYITAAILGGVAVDRLGFRRASVLADLGSGAAIVLIPLLHATAGLAFWQILPLIFLATLLNTPGIAARRSMLPALAERSGLGLERINALDQAVGNAATLIGPLLAGVLLASLAAADVLWLDAASFLVSALLIGTCLPHFQPEGEAGDFLPALRAGLDFIRRERVVRVIALNGTFANAIGTALFGVVLPVYADRVLRSATGLGLLAAADGGGALLGTLAFGMLCARLPKRATLLAAFIVSAGVLAVLALTPPLPLTVLVLLVDGATFGLIGPVVYTIYQKRVPAELRGRVFGALLAIHRLAVPAGAVAAGVLLGILSIPMALGAIAALSLLMPLVILLSPALRDL